MLSGAASKLCLRIKSNQIKSNQNYCFFNTTTVRPHVRFLVSLSYVCLYKFTYVCVILITCGAETNTVLIEYQIYYRRPWHSNSVTTRRHWSYYKHNHFRSCSTVSDIYKQSEVKQIVDVNYPQRSILAFLCRSQYQANNRNSNANMHKSKYRHLTPSKQSWSSESLENTT